MYTGHGSSNSRSVSLGAFREMNGRNIFHSSHRNELGRMRPSAGNAILHSNDVGRRFFVQVNYLLGGERNAFNLVFEKVRSVLSCHGKI